MKNIILLLLIIPTGALTDKISLQKTNKFDWLAENQHLVKPMGLGKINP